MELFDTHFVEFGQVLAVSGQKNVSYKKPICRSGKITTAPRLFSDRSLKNQNKHHIMNVHTKWNCLMLFSDRSLKNQNKHHIMNVHTKWKLFDVHFVEFGQVLAVSVQKTLAIRNRYVEVVKSQLHLDYFQNTHSKIKTNIRL